MSTLVVDSLSDGSTTKTIAALLANVSGAGALTSWAQYVGTGTAALNDNDNVTSITDNGTGDYTFTFTAAMANDDYGLGATAGDAGLDLFATNAGNTDFLAASIQLLIYDDAGTATDPDIGTFQQYGDLA